MYLWDSNIVRHFGEGQPILQQHLQRISWADIALPSVVVAEILRGRCEYALKASPSDAPVAHRRLIETQYLIQQFHVLVFDQQSAKVLQTIRTHRKAHKRYADLMIAAMAQAGQHIVVTRNQKHFVDLLPPPQLMNWIDEPPR